MASLHRGVMRVLLGDITSGSLAAGERLPSQRKLAVQFDVSTGVIRECQRALEERGLLSVSHGRRAIVGRESDWDVFDPEVLAGMVAGRHTTHVLGEYLEARRILEVEAAGLAAERATPHAIRELAAAFGAMRAAARRAERNPAAEPLYHRADVEFHRAIIRAAGNRPMARMAEPIHRALGATFGTLARPQVRFERGLPEHARILDAIREHDPAAARKAMRDHLLTVEDYLSEHAAGEPAHDGVGQSVEKH